MRRQRLHCGLRLGEDVARDLDATLSAARLALRTRKGIEDRTIRATPRNLPVPPGVQDRRHEWA